MAFGKTGPKHQQSDYPIEETDSAVLEKAVTMKYGGFIPQRYINPLLPQTQDEVGEVANNVERGTEAHGLYGDSHVHPKDIQTLDYPLTTDKVEEILPEYEASEDKYDPINVRIVDEKPNEITRVVIGSAIVQASTMTGPNAPVRIVGQDAKRTRVLIGTSGTITGTLVLLTDLNQNPAYGFPLPAANAQPLEIRGDQELWVSGVAAADTGTVVTMAERRVNGDAQHPSN